VEAGDVRNRLVHQQELPVDVLHPVAKLAPEGVRHGPRHVAPESVHERGPLVDHVEEESPNLEVRVVQVRDQLPVEVRPRLARLLPLVAVAVRGVRILVGVLEPLVVARGVIGDEVEQHPHPVVVGRLDQRLVVVALAEVLGHVEEVGDVVAVRLPVVLEDRREPQRVDAEFRNRRDPVGDRAERLPFPSSANVRTYTS